MCAMDFFYSDEREHVLQGTTLTVDVQPTHSLNNHMTQINTPAQPSQPRAEAECFLFNKYHGNNTRPRENVDLHIIGHNINGMRGNNQKFKMLRDYCSAKHIDVFGISETNISQKD